MGNMCAAAQPRSLESIGIGVRISSISWAAYFAAKPRELLLRAG